MARSVALLRGINVGGNNLDRARGALLRSAHREGLTEPALEDRLAADLSEPDDPQLGDACKLLEMVEMPQS
jgi:hypothetical protein